MEAKKQRLDTIPSCVLVTNVFPKLELETLCSLACVSTSLNSSVSKALPSISSLNLNAFCPKPEILGRILNRCRGARSLNVSCLRLNDSSFTHCLAKNIEEINLLFCSFLTYHVMVSIGEACPNLRVLVLELQDEILAEKFKINMNIMLDGCPRLESLSIKLRYKEGINLCRSIEFLLPTSLKSIKLQPMLEVDVVNSFFPTSSLGSPVSSSPVGFALQRLSLVLDFISDRLISILTVCGHLVELNLEDRPLTKPRANRDLTNTGMASLAACFRLKGLSLVRSRLFFPALFKEVDDMGMFSLKSCISLESVTLCGFSKVSDAGYTSVLQSCPKLKKFEVRYASLLTDLTFVDLNRFSCSLVEVTLLSCRHITSETVNQLTSSRALEVLDLHRCKSITDSCLISIALLHSLTKLNLSAANISDHGLSALGKGTPPITNLCLRHCMSVTDEGVSMLFLEGGTISKTLSSLDLGFIPGISDKAVHTIAVAGTEMTELCLRCCSSVTDSSVEALATRKQCRDDLKLLRSLDLHNCSGLSTDSVRFLKRPLFPGLHWLGVGQTRLSSPAARLSDVGDERPWLTICVDGCEMGCHNGWQGWPVPGLIPK